MHEICESITLVGTGVQYDGIYNRQPSLINGFDWWQGRDDIAGVGQNLRVKLYYYKGMNGRRWRLEGPVYSFFAANDEMTAADVVQSEGTASDYGAESPCGALQGSPHSLSVGVLTNGVAKNIQIK